MTQVIKISKPGFNAVTETDPNNLVFSSQYNTLKYSSSIITKQVTLTVLSFTENTNSDTQSHGLSYVPWFISYVKNDYDNLAKPLTSFTTTGQPGVGFFGSVYCDSTDLHFFVYGINTTFSDITVTFTFYTKVYKNRIGLT